MYRLPIETDRLIPDKGGKYELDRYTARMKATKYQTVLKEIHSMMENFDHTWKDIGYAERWTFANGLWFDLIDYRETDSVILRVGRGARLVREYPILYSLFDQVMTVIAKLEIHGIETLEEKNVAGLIKLLAEQPKGKYPVR